ncbi:MAG: efflux RND transporter periplasmic adaptor subunit [Vulcanimicrobiaceae bacterium]
MKVRNLACFVLAGALASGCGGGQKKAPPGPPPLAVDVAKASQRDIATSITLDGQIAPLQEATLSTPESGTITAIYVNEGDRVARGQLLAKLDDSQLRAQLAANEATVAQSRARLQSSDVQAPIASQQYASALTSAQQQLLQARNRVATDEAALKNAELVYRSNQQLVSQGYVSQTAAEQARATYIAAVQELNNARQAVPAVQGLVTTAQSNTGQAGVDRATIAANKAALAQAQANVSLLQTQIAQASLYASFDGVVTQRLLDPGAFAGPNQPIVRVSQLDTVYVNANVPDEDLAFVRAGTRAQFTSQSLPGKTFSGTIGDVNATPTTGTLSYRARIRQPNPGRVLRGGMLVSLVIVKERHPRAIVVPRTALFQSDQGANVYTVVDGKAKVIPVKVGIETDTLAEVTGGGVRPGTVVITTRPDALQNGSVVAVSGAGPANAPGAKSTH